MSEENDSKSSKDFITYKDSGVDVDRGERIATSITDMLESTWGDDIIPNVSGFKAVYDMGDSYLIGATDGPGTKIIISKMMGDFSTIGQDIVAMTANDLARVGAKPLFFLDYMAHGDIPENKNLEFVHGIAKACRESGIAFIGGETAEMPDVYGKGEMDASGFIVGMAEKDKLISGADIKSGAGIIGLASSGIHANGYSMARNIVFKKLGLSVNDYIEEFGRTLGEELLEPTLVYTKQVGDILNNFPEQVQGMAHITGGGMPNKLPKALPEGLGAYIEEGSWPIHPVFDYLQENGPVEDEEMKKTFNRGIGYTFVVNDKGAIDDMIARLDEEHDMKAYEIGEIGEGQGVTYVGGEK